MSCFSTEDLNDWLNKNFQNASSQTELSLPPVLPSELEKALKPYFTFTQDQVESFERSFKNSFPRRILLGSNLYENEMSVSFQDQETTPLKTGLILTPKFRESILRGQISARYFGTPLPGAAFTPPSTSPIEEDNHKMQIPISCNSSFVRTLNFDNQIEKDDDKEDMSFLVLNEPVEDEPMESGEAPSGPGST